MWYGCLGISSTYGMDTVFCSSLLFFACPVWCKRISVRIPGRWRTGALPGSLYVAFPNRKQSYGALGWGYFLEFETEIA